MKKPAFTLLAAGVAAALSLTACGGTASSTQGKGTELEGLTGVFGAKDFSEQFILSHITSQILNAHGAETSTNTSVVGSANVRTAFESGQFAGYWEYTGTSWITYNKQTTPLKDKEEMFQAVKEADAKKGIAWLDPAPLNNTYAFAIREDKAKELGVKTLSDVAKLPASEQTFCVESEFSPGTTAGRACKRNTDSARTRRSPCWTPESSTPPPRKARTATSAKSSKPTAASQH